MRWLRRLLGLALVVAAMAGGWKLAATNDAIVTVRYLWGVADLRLWQALLAAFGAGVAVTGAGWCYSRLKSGLVLRRYRKAVAKLESEVHELRNLPLAPGADSEQAADPEAAGAGRSGRGG